MADTRTRRRTRDDDYEDTTDRGLPDDTDREDDAEDREDVTEDDKDPEEDLPTSRRRGKADMEKSLRTQQNKRRRGVSRADSLIKALEDHADLDLPRAFREALREVLPDFEEAAIEKAMSRETPRSEVRVSDLIADIGAEFSEALSPLLERLKRSEARAESIEKALVDMTEAWEDQTASYEKLQKSLEVLPEQDKLLKAIVEGQDLKSRTTPARHRTDDIADAAEPLEKSTVGLPGTEQSREGLPDSDADSFQASLARAEALRSEHSVDVPGYSSAIGAYGAGRVTREIAETLSKGVTDVENELNLRRA